MKAIRQTSLSLRIYLALVAILVMAAMLNPFLPQGDLPPGQELPASPGVMALVTAAVVLILYGGLGLIGLKLARRLGFAEVWDVAVSNRQRFLIPALMGSSLGLFFIGTDTLFAAWRPGGPLPHPPFPTSLVASIVAGIGEEIIFRLFFVSFWVWLAADLLLGGRWQTPIFWIAAVASGLVFALAHLPAVMITMGFASMQAIPPLLLVELILLNGALSLTAAYYLRTYGFLAAVGLHFWTDVVWHVVWGVGGN